MWYEQDAEPASASRQRDGFAAKARRGRRRRRRLPLGRGRQRHRRPDQRAGHRPARNHFGSCAESPSPRSAPARSTSDATVDAEDPRVAAGTLAPGGTTVPWVAWAEDIGGGSHAIFVVAPRRRRPLRAVQRRPADLEHRSTTRRGPTSRSRATRRTSAGSENVGGAGAHVHRPLRGRRSRAGLQARHPGRHRPTPAGTADLRAPISSTCTANPFNADGARLPGQRRRHAVLPVHRRRPPAAAVRARLRAERHRDRRRPRPSPSVAPPSRARSTRAAPHQGALRLRDDDRLRQQPRRTRRSRSARRPRLRRRARRASPRTRRSTSAPSRPATSGRSSVPTRPSRR